jgi:hypothetical protein
MLLDHQEAYKRYTPVADVEVRSCLEQIARLFTDLDEFFAAMFVHVVLSSDATKLSSELARIRHEITSRQATDISQGDSRGSIYLGDLGHYCEALLKLNKQSEHKPDVTTSPPEFRPTHSDEQSWIDYLEDGFEIPYWKLMLNAFSTSRLRKSTLGGKVIATALISMRSDIVDLRCTLQKVLGQVPDHEDIEGILSVIDKRIKILQGFTDRVALDKLSRNRRLGTDVDANDNTEANTGSSIGNQVTHHSLELDQMRTSTDFTLQSSTSDPLLLVTLVLLTLIAAIVPFTLGFKASNETGTTSDADFWYNISSSIFTIMANFVMITQLTQGSRLSNRYMYVWIWFALGIVCAIISVAIYPFCNTAWSSLLSFFATIAGFGATLSVAMTVANPRSDEPPAKKKID